MADQDLDRSEQATPYKLEEARKRGQVARSADFTATAIVAGLVVTVYAGGWDALRQALRMQQWMLARATRIDWSVDAMADWLGQLLIGMLAILGPLFLALAVAAVLACLVQTGPVFSFHPLKPDMSRISPANGFKRLFSMRTLFEALKSLVKLALLSTVVYFIIADTVAGLLGLSAMAPKGYAGVMVGLVGALLVKLLMAMLLIGLADLVYTRREFAKQMRMSKRDVRDELKNREGDPRIRARIRELRKEILKRSKSMAKLPGADVLITNPTRLAVALTYSHGVSGAPQVVAKGAGELAAKMRRLAARHNIPVVQNRQLARTLFREVDYDCYVPEKLYPQIARIMVWVYSMREAHRASKRTF